MASLKSIERRSFRAHALRAENDDGKQYLSGYAATYNTLSGDLGFGMRERIVPGAFTRALAEKQDVRHLINHDPSQVLGRTKSGTTILSEDGKGLRFRTLINPQDPQAVSLLSKVERGDIDECSFGFIAVRTAWIEEPDPEDENKTRCVRELHDVDLFDVSTVTYPAYPGTNTAVGRALRADGHGVPAEFRARVTGSRSQDGECQCGCVECVDGDCADCSNPDCDDPNCRCMDMRSGNDDEKTKRVDGEDLTSDCFLIVGDPEDTSTWKLPWKFSTEEKTKSHLKNALARFNQLKGVSEEDKKTAWTKLVKLCKQHGVEVSEESSLRTSLTPEQVYDLEKDSFLQQAKLRMRSLEADIFI